MEVARLAKYVAPNWRSQGMHVVSGETQPPTDPRRQAKVNQRSRPVNLGHGGSPRDRFHLLNSAPPAEERDLRERKRRLEGDTSRPNGSFSDSAPDSNRSPAVPSQAAAPEGPPNDVSNRRKQEWPTYAAHQRRLEMPQNKAGHASETGPPASLINPSKNQSALAQQIASAGFQRGNRFPSRHVNFDTPPPCPKVADTDLMRNRPRLPVAGFCLEVPSPSAANPPSTRSGRNLAFKYPFRSTLLRL